MKWIILICITTNLCMPGTKEYASKDACTAALEDMIKVTERDKPEYLEMAKRAKCVAS